MGTKDTGGCYVLDDDILDEKLAKDFYLTITYKISDNNIYKEDLGKLEYYIDGNLFGYTYFGSDSYRDGLTHWNGNNVPFFLGVCPWNKDNNLYYLKGLVYSTRLYTKPMTEKQVKDSYNMTLRYRSSFLGK